MSTTPRPICGDNSDRDRNLHRITLLHNLTPADRGRIAAACHWRRVAARQNIIDGDTDTREIFFVISGTVRVVNYSASGREVSFADCHAGDTVGELSAIDGEPRSADVFALEEAVLAGLSPARFRALVGEHPDVAFGIMRGLARMVRDASRRIMDLSTLSAHNRVHGELLRLARDGTRDDGSAVIRPAPPHADIAARASTTRETVARTLSDLARDSLVIRRGGALTVPDIEKLAALVEDPQGM